jgi:1-phosphofructokinase family hexose kinase
MIYTVTLNPALDRELTVDSVRLGDVLRATSRRDEPGGKGFNVSRALCALGKSSVALGFLDQSMGATFAAALERDGLTLVAVPCAGETRVNVSIVGAEGPGIKVNEPGPVILPREWEAMRKEIRDRCRPGDWWIFSGSLPPGLAVDSYRELIDLVQTIGARAILDTGGEALRLGCLAAPFLIKPNAEEALEALGLPPKTSRDPDLMARDLMTLGARGVFLTLGKLGALSAREKEVWKAWSPKIAEKNPTAAGDAALAGFVAALDEGMPWNEALRWGIACGAAAASCPGSGVGSRADVEALYREVQPLAL